MKKSSSGLSTSKSQSSLGGGNKKAGPIKTPFADRIVTGGKVGGGR